MKKITVITTCLNSKLTVRKTIESIISTRYTNLEHIFIDAGSTDGTIEILGSYPHLRVFIKRGISISEAWNFGIQNSSGDLIYILNSDDFVTPDIFNIALNDVKKSNSSFILIGNVSIIDSDGRLVRQVNGERPRLTNIFKGLPFMHPSVIATKDIYDKIGLFDLAYRIGLDSEWLIRAYVSKVNFIKSSYSVYMLSGGISERRMWVGFGEYLETLHKHKVPVIVIIAALLNKIMLILKNVLIPKKISEKY